MYKTYVPLMNSNITDQNKYDYIELLKNAEVSNVFLVVSDFENTAETQEGTLIALKKNIEFFKQNDICTNVWVATTIGHGMSLMGVGVTRGVNKYQSLVNLNGVTLAGTNCPCDKNFCEDISKYIARIATLGVETILLDDDFRMSQRSSTFCCACSDHLSLMSEKAGREITIDNIKELVFSPKPTKYRAAYLYAQGEPMKRLAKQIRKEVDKENPNVRIALCSAYSPWDIDGADALELAIILAGRNTPMLRLHGAPYWVVKPGRVLSESIEVSRMCAAFCENSDAEILAEGDCYPRPRHNVPSAYLELFDAAIRMDGTYDGMLKYMSDYSAHPLYEIGYFKAHTNDLPFFKNLQKIFEGGANYGVRVFSTPHNFEHADLSLSPASEQSPYPIAAMLLANATIPTVHRGNGICTAIFGESARHIEKELLNNGGILDATAAIILKQNGVDTGIHLSAEFEQVNLSYIKNEPVHSVIIKNGQARVWPKFSANADVVLWGVEGSNSIPLAYKYKNTQGQRFFVWLYDASSLPHNSGLLRGYIFQAALLDCVSWISRESLQAIVDTHPDLYMMCRKNQNSLAISLINCFADKIIDLQISLSESWSNAEFINCKGKMEDGKITLSKPINAFDMAVIRLTNNQANK